MRARGIKPSLFKNELLGTADPLFTIVFEGLWCLADREGRLEDRPLRIHAEVNPYRHSESTVQALCWLVQHGFVRRYEAGGVKCLEVVNFKQHQQPHMREASSKLPAFENQEVVEAPCKHSAGHQPSTGPARLIPDSGFLIPDSRNTREPENPKPNSVPRGTRPPVEKVQSCYPAGTYRAADWIMAERSMAQLIDDGEKPADLVAAAAAYAMQQQAKGSAGTQYVLSPAKFYGTGAWRGPFPIPKAQAKPGDDPAALAAWDALIASDGAQRDDRVQHALDAVGGWMAVRQRTAFDEAKLRAAFCRAYADEVAA